MTKAVKHAAIGGYISAVEKIWKTGTATELSYRGELQTLLSDLLPGMTVLNEPKHRECGAPDYIIMDNGLPKSFVEAKDIGDADLDGKKKTGNKEQFDRYKAALPVIVFTDYLDFKLYLDGEPAGSARIAEECGGKIAAIPADFDKFLDIADALGNAKPLKIASAGQLAKMMAGKARMLQETTSRFLAANAPTSPGAMPATSLGKLMADFRRVLMPNVGIDEFSDIYAQTVTYGMFAARLHDKTPGTFDRFEAAALIPKSNPFLQQLFNQLALSLDPEIAWVADDIAELFKAADVAKIMKDYGKATHHADPMIHFYEDFLAAYDAGLRKDRGVWYTPISVVRFIVRAVDKILHDTFGLQDGLADASKTKICVDQLTNDGKKLVKKVTKEVHRVQVLDPATGTGTFLAECIHQIHAKFAGNEGKWPGYVQDDLLPRLNGFELLMASYTMAHVKLDLVLESTGYTHTSTQRFNVFLTDSLTPEVNTSHGLLFSLALGEEAEAASFVKRDCPVMVVMGNPPYNGESDNKHDFIMKLMEDYKKEPGGKQKLQERNPKWLNDDYVKFLRLAENYIERNGSGIVAFINPHGFLDNPTFRGMRWHLLQTFDEIYILNLHGNAKKKEVAPDGSKDDNVFNIMQGVSINIFVKKNKNGCAPCSVHYADLWGKRCDKFAILNTATLDSINWQELNPVEPLLFFVPKNTAGEEEYNKGFRIDELLAVNSTGSLTANDELNISFSIEEQKEKIKNLLTLPENEWRTKNGRLHDSRDWQYLAACKDASSGSGKMSQICYRPFDKRYTFYTGNSRGLYTNPRFNVMQHLNRFDNIALIACKLQSLPKEWSLFHIADSLVDDCFVSNKTKERGYVFPLYLYQENMGKVEKVANLNPEIVTKLEAAIGDVRKGRWSIEEFISGEPVASLSGQEFLGLSGVKTIRDAVYASFGRVGHRAFHPQIGEVRLTRSGVNDSLRHGFGRAKLSAFAALPELIGHGVIVEHKENWKERGYETFVLAAPLLIGGDSHFAIVVVKRVQNGDTNYYLHEVGRMAELKNAARGVAVPGETEGERSGLAPRRGRAYPPNGSMRSIAYSLFAVKGADDGKNMSRSLTPEEIFDYIYAVLHTPGYREKYREFLKVDFPRIPYPKDAETFARLAKVGGELRRCHLMQDPAPSISEKTAAFPVCGDNTVDRVEYDCGKVYINDTQHFANVPSKAWEMYIGGYQPAQKWLKDRRGRKLSQSDLTHYQRIILALLRTNALMATLTL